MQLYPSQDYDALMIIPNGIKCSIKDYTKHKEDIFTGL
jgi:hypothetical protein